MDYLGWPVLGALGPGMSLLHVARKGIPFSNTLVVCGPDMVPVEGAFDASRPDALLATMEVGLRSSCGRGEGLTPVPVMASAPGWTQRRAGS